MRAEDLTDKELREFTIIERVVSVFSLLGCLFIITTFSLYKTFHKPINRLVFYASIGNMMTNVATLMARSYLGDVRSAGCQMQAFLIQMCMPADAFWTLAMAINVHLTFYYKFDAQKLRRMELPYLLCCYGLPFAVALSYIFIDTADRGRMYGNATIWCWVSSSWDMFRILTFYGPVWVVIVVTCFIYIRAGREIYRKHRQLKDLNYTSLYDPEPFTMLNNPFNIKTTEVTVSVSDAPETMHHLPLGISARNRRNSLSGQPGHPAAYTVCISAARPPAPGAPGAPSPPPTPGQRPPTPTTPCTPPPQHRRHHHQQQQPSSPPPPPPPPPHQQQPARQRRRAAVDASNAAWSYTKVAMLFFTAMLVTWIPSSANRLFSLAAGGGEISLPLEYMSAFVLPLQGVWNAVIYCVTSWQACKLLAADVAALLFSRRHRRGCRRGGRRHHHHHQPQQQQPAAAAAVASSPPPPPLLPGACAFAGPSKDSETESMEELAERVRSGRSFCAWREGTSERG